MDVKPGDRTTITFLVENLTDTYITYDSNHWFVDMRHGDEGAWSPDCPNARTAVVLYASLDPRASFGLQVDYPGQDEQCRPPPGEYVLEATFRGCRSTYRYEKNDGAGERCDGPWRGVTASMQFRQR